MEIKHSGSLRSKKFPSYKSAGKVLASMFSGSRGIILNDYQENHNWKVLISIIRHSAQRNSK